jgi:hypothetical protein
MSVIDDQLWLVSDRLSNARFNLASEKDLQDGIETVLSGHGWPYGREVRLDAQDRIDFLLGNGIGIEVKIDKSLSAVTRQLHRYAQQPLIVGLLLVTTRMRLRALPPEFNGKPTRVVCLLGSTL